MNTSKLINIAKNKLTFKKNSMYNLLKYYDQNKLFNFESDFIKYDLLRNVENFLTFLNEKKLTERYYTIGGVRHNIEIIVEFNELCPSVIDKIKRERQMGELLCQYENIINNGLSRSIIDNSYIEVRDSRIYNEWIYSDILNKLKNNKFEKNITIMDNEVQHKNVHEINNIVNIVEYNKLTQQIWSFI